MNRIDRLSAILIQLQSKKVVRAQEIADRFDISLRTVYRDIHALEQGGIPIIGEAGVGYSIMEGYRLPPVMFTREEATTFLVAEKLLEKYADQHTGEVFKSAVYKIKAVLRTAEKDFLSGLDDHVVIMKHSVLPGPAERPHTLHQVLTAINEKKLLLVNYTGLYANQRTNRQIEPVGIFHQNAYWYLIGFCRLRNDYRNFRVDRINSLEILDEHFESQHKPLASFLEFTSREQAMETVVLELSKDAARYMITEKYYHGFVSEKDIGEMVEMTFLTSSLKGIARWFTGFGNEARVISPESLKEEVCRHLELIRKNL